MHSHPIQGRGGGGGGRGGGEGGGEGGGLGISVFSRPGTGCIVKGQDRAGRISLPTSVGRASQRRGCIIGARPLTVVEIRQACRSDGQSQTEVWLQGGVATAQRGGARSGSVSRLISRCHSATVGYRREGQPRSTQESAGSVGKGQ